MKIMGKLKNYKERWNKIKYLIDIENNLSGDYDDKYMEIRFNSNYHLRLKSN